jgi:hypothetical protein
LATPADRVSSPPVELPRIFTPFPNPSQQQQQQSRRNVMPFLQLLRKPSAIRSKFSIGSARNLLDRKTSTRCQSTNTNPTSTSKANGGHAASSKAYSRLDRVLDRFPKPLRRYTDALKGAPVTHVVSFLVLHEITAIVPLVGLSCLFHWGNWLPSVSLHLSQAEAGSSVRIGLSRSVAGSFGRMDGRRK